MITEIDKTFSKELSEYLKDCDVNNLTEIENDVKNILNPYIENNNFEDVKIRYTRTINYLDVSVEYKNPTSEIITATAMVI